MTPLKLKTLPLTSEIFPDRYNKRRARAQQIAAMLAYGETKREAEQRAQRVHDQNLQRVTFSDGTRAIKQSPLSFDKWFGIFGFALLIIAGALLLGVIIAQVSMT